MQRHNLSLALIFLTVLMCSVASHAQSHVQIQQPSDPKELTKDLIEFRKFLDSNRVLDKQKAVDALKLDRQIAKDPKSVRKGGWNGTGGGGGLACFKNPETLGALVANNLANPKGVIEGMQNFTMLDLFDIDNEVDWPVSDFDPYAFLEKRIVERLGPKLPILAASLISEFEAVRNAPRFSQKWIDAFDDLGPMSSGKKIPGTCAYVQWAVRYQYTAAEGPQFVLAINSALENRLKEILTLRELSIQKAVLDFHEAVYGLFTHVHHHPDSTTVRSFTDLLLIPDSYYRKYLVNEKVDSTFWSLWIRDALPVMEYAGKRYATFAAKQGASPSLSKERLERWSSYLSFISKTRYVLDEIGKGIESGQLQTMNSIQVANPDQDLHRMAVGGFAFLVFASDFDPGPGTNRISDAEAFFLVASELEAARKIDSVQRMILENVNSSHWKNACHQVLRTSKEADLAATRSQSDPLLGPKAWVTKRAQSYCEEIGVISKQVSK